MAVDGTVWRTPDTPENDAAFGRTANINKFSEWPQVRMVCQMEVTCHLLSAAAFDSVSAVGEADLAAQLIPQTPNHSLTLLIKVFMRWVCYTPGSRRERKDTGCRRCAKGHSIVLSVA